VGHYTWVREWGELPASEFVIRKAPKAGEGPYGWLKCGCSGGECLWCTRWGKNWKGRDIGYALAAASCEGANSVDACTVTAPWCDHCFHSSKPQLPLAEPSVFSGLAALRVAPPGWSPSLLRVSNFIRRPFQPSTGATL